MRWPRMTMRRWMITVLVAGLLLGGIVGRYRLKRRHDSFLAHFRYHVQTVNTWERQERTVRHLARVFEEHNELGSAEHERFTAGQLARRVAYHAAMARKYRHAARHPWLPVGPDPPEPEFELFTRRHPFKTSIPPGS